MANCFVKRLRTEQSRAFSTLLSIRRRFSRLGSPPKAFSVGQNFIQISRFYERVMGHISSEWRRFQPRYPGSPRKIRRIFRGVKTGVPAKRMFCGVYWRDTASKPLPHRDPRRKYFRWGLYSIPKWGVYAYPHTPISRRILYKDVFDLCSEWKEGVTTFPRET